MSTIATLPLVTASLILGLPEGPGTVSRVVSVGCCRIMTVTRYRLFLHYYREAITGVDLVAVHGISDALAQTILAEVGTDMAKWPDDKHFCSWLGLAPKNDISGGKVLKSRTMKNRNRAAQAFRMAAQSVIRADCAFGAFYRRLKGRLGPAQALVATAHKIACTVYHIKDRVQYDDIGAAEYNKRFREREMHYLQKKAAKLGYTLSPA